MKKTVSLCLIFFILLNFSAAINAESLYNPDTSGWIPYEMPNWNVIPGTALDASYLRDAPAGKHGGVKVKNGDLFFEDGTPAKFWGTNIAGQGCFFGKYYADDMVSAVSAYGYNMVRLHHLDSTAFVPNIFGSAPLDRSRLDPEQMKQFNYLWSELKKKGIYIFLDFMGIRHLSKEDALKLGYDDEMAERLSYAPWAFTAIKYFDKDLQDIQKDYMKKLLTYENPYTGTTLAEDPAFAACCIANEDTLFKNDWLFENLYHSDYFKNEVCTQFAAWLKDKYKTNEALYEAWFESGKIGKQESDDINGLVYLDNGYFYSDRNLSSAKTTDIRKFFEYKMAEYYKEMKSYLKDELKIKAVVCGSNNFGESVSAENLSYVDSDMDFIDQHAYYGGYEINYLDNGKKVGSENFVSMLKQGNSDRNIITYCARRAVYNKPTFQSEWNMILPSEYAAEANYFVAAYGAFQGFNSLHYNLMQEREGLPSYVAMSTIWSSWHQPLYTSAMCAAAHLALGGHVSKANGGYYLPVSEEDAMKPDFMPEFPEGVEFKTKTGIVYENKVSKEELENIKKENAIYESGANPQTIHSDSEQLSLNSSKGVFRVNTPKSKVAAGFIGGEKIPLGKAVFNIDNKYASVALTSLSNKNIESSEKLLLSATARARNTGMEYDENGEIMTNRGLSPILLEPVCGRIEIKTDKNYKVYALDWSGRRTVAVPSERTKDGYFAFDISGDYQTVHYELEETNEPEGEYSVSIDYASDTAVITGNLANSLIWITDENGKILSMAKTDKDYEKESISLLMNTWVKGTNTLNIRCGDDNAKKTKSIDFITDYNAAYSIENLEFLFGGETTQISFNIKRQGARKKMNVCVCAYDENGALSEMKKKNGYIYMGDNPQNFSVKYIPLGTYKVFLWDNDLKPVVNIRKY